MKTSMCRNIDIENADIDVSKRKHRCFSKKIKNFSIFLEKHRISFDFTLFLHRFYKREIRRFLKNIDKFSFFKKYRIFLL